MVYEDKILNPLFNQDEEEGTSEETPEEETSEETTEGGESSE